MAKSHLFIAFDIFLYYNFVHTGEGILKMEAYYEIDDSIGYTRLGILLPKAA